MLRMQCFSVRAGSERRDTRLALGPAPAREAASLPVESAQEAARRGRDRHGAGAADALAAGRGREAERD